MTHTYNDGSTIETGWGGVYPPGRKGSDVASLFLWVRMDGGEWHTTHKRSMRETWEWIKAADTASEAFEVICPGVLR